MEFLLSNNPQCGSTCDHTLSCNSCTDRFLLIQEIEEVIMTLDEESQKQYHSKLLQIDQKMKAYIAHIVRGKYQREKFHEDINTLQPGKCVAVADYMMKLLFMKMFEPQKDWFAKKGVSLHGTMFIYKDLENRLFFEFHDIYSEQDDKQNWFFSACCLEESFQNFHSLHPEISSANLWTGNGPHYKNTTLVIWLPKLSVTGITLHNFRNFEPQKGKTKLDGHYATLKFSLKRYMKEGHDITCGKDIENGTFRRLKGTHVYGIQINRENEPPSAHTLKGITLFSSFQYHYDSNQTFLGLTASYQTVNVTSRSI